MKLKKERDIGNVSYVPGAFMNWELMVGNTNTRWSYTSKAGDTEPPIPFDAWLFPDGTPVSYTEVLALRQYLTGKNPFLMYEDFLPPSWQQGDAILTIQPGTTW